MIGIYFARVAVLAAALALLTALCGCDPAPKDPYAVPIAATVPVEGESRIKAEYVGHFYAGYDNHIRAVLILTDTKTGKEYLTITGCGTTELWTETHQAGKVTVTSTREE